MFMPFICSSIHYDILKKKKSEKILSNYWLAVNWPGAGATATAGPMDHLVDWTQSKMENLAEGVVGVVSEETNDR